MFALDHPNILKVFEDIIATPEKMAFYKRDPILEACFMGMHAFKKAGHNFIDLPWFVLSKKAKEKGTFKPHEWAKPLSKAA